MDETKRISADEIRTILIDNIKNSLINVDSNTCRILDELSKDECGTAKWALEQIIENNRIATKTASPACQDTGCAVFFVDIGQNVFIEGSLEQAINDSVRIAYKESSGRMSIADPLTRINTKTNTPSVIHYRIIDGNSLKISFLAKGAGSENMGGVYMLSPSKGRDGIILSVLDCVQRAGANPCPPIIVGVGIGGTMDYAAVLSKRALLRKTGEPHPNIELAELERDILTKINALGIGIQGFGGKNTAMAVAIEEYPTHIGMLPVAVNIQCHCVRHFTIEL